MPISSQMGSIGGTEIMGLVSERRCVRSTALPCQITRYGAKASPGQRKVPCAQATGAQPALPVSAAETAVKRERSAVMFPQHGTSAFRLLSRIRTLSGSVAPQRFAIGLTHLVVLEAACGRLQIGCLPHLSCRGAGAPEAPLEVCPPHDSSPKQQSIRACLRHLKDTDYPQM